MNSNREFNCFLLLFYVPIVFGLLLTSCVAYEQYEEYDPYENNPRLVSRNGDLAIYAGRNKDLHLISAGSGKIKLNRDDLSTNVETGGRTSQQNANQVVEALNKLHTRFQGKIDQLNGTIIRLASNPSTSRMRKRVRFLLKRLAKLEKMLARNECASNPCRHGSTCEDGFNRYFCRCAEGYQGMSCEQDIDECARFQGTDMGCQNGGTCLNTFGSFRCMCPPNYQGRHCAVLFDDCHNASNTEICDHGVCLNLPRKDAGSARYRCGCFQGWGKSRPGENSPCDADIDECASGEHKCSRNPPVRCINRSPGYDCGSCPAGYSGDGFTCVPFDDCLTNNGGCSMSPRVACYSSPTGGGVSCGSCPPGYSGDGRTCLQIDGDICSVNNGGCSPTASCRPNSAISANYRDCICLYGYSGNGIGQGGCVPSKSSVPTRCLADTCKNGGTCTEFNNRALCLCPVGFQGLFCETGRAFCDSQPCRNGAECVPHATGYSCICTAEYSGTNCERSRAPCGGELDSEAGVLAYPMVNVSSYGNNISCEWIIRNSREPGKVLNITFTKFKIEQSSRCAFDFLELYDGPSREYKNVGRFCGDSLPNKNGIFISSFNSIVLRFKSDISVAMDGFELNWITVDPTCGGMVLNVTHGMLESPGFPHHYPNNLDCYWKIFADYGKRIQFVFTHLDIETSTNCSYDFLEFREGFRGEGEQIAKFCNWTASQEYSVPPPITSAGSVVRVHFHSDMASHAKGFKMHFHQVPGICGGLLTGSEGIFRPPSTTYVSQNSGRTVLVYQNNVVCDWIIRALPNERISLKFLQFALEADSLNFNSKNASNCVFDNVEVYDGKELNSPLRARLCGRIRPPEIISSGRFLRVKFRSDLSVSQRGFIAKYTALCGGQYNDLNGTFESPNFPSPTKTAKNCTYLLTVPLGHVVRLNITTMDIEHDQRCTFDYLLIEGERYCGNVPPPLIISANNEMRITYVNDETRPSRGFQASWDSLEIGCGGVVNQGDPPMVISPNQMRDQPPVSQCLWEIRAKLSYLVRLMFLPVEFGVRRNNPASARLYTPACNFTTMSHVMVNDSDGSLINRFCLDRLPPTLTSSRQKIFVTYFFREFNNSSSEEWVNQIMRNLREPRTFSMNYYFVPDQAVCGRNLFSNTGVINSPRFPRRYPPNMNCTWIIHVDNGLQIKLNFTKFFLEPAGDIVGQCYDYLEIRNGRRFDSPLIGKFCGNGPLPSVVSHSNYLFLRFVSDSSTQSRGFELQYETLTQSGCGGVLTAESGTIESPDFPNSYFANLNCEWKIRVASGSTLRLQFETLSLENSGIEAGCSFDFLELFDGENGDVKSLGKVCNLQAPLIVNGIESKSNNFFIRFTSDATVSQGGFRVNYNTNCNRTIVGRYGIIESPNYPDPHPHNMNCTWRLIAPRGNNISVAFSALSLESGFECIFDYVNISQVNRRQQISTDQVSRIASPYYQYNLTNVSLLCGDYTQQLPEPIHAGSNEILINFISDETRSIRSGFRLEWAAQGCGAEFINREQGVILSPNYPNPYPFDTECIWHIRAPDGKRVDLLIDTLDLEYSKNCVFDYLEVFGGRDEDAPRLARLCNQVKNIHLSSLGNWMTLKLFSDLSAPRRGFNISFTTTQTGCGGHFDAPRGSIFSPNYGRGNQYDPKAECEYRIETKGDFILELTINDLDIPGSIPNCSQGYLALYDGDQSALDLPDTEDLRWIKLCGTMKDIENRTLILSKDSHINLRFKGNSENSGRGFNATFRRICGKTIVVDDRDEYRTIESPDYPHMSPLADDHCRYILKAKNPGERIAVRFTHIQAFNLPVELDTRATNTCLISSVDIYEGASDKPEKRLDHFCSQFIPKPLMSNGDTMLVVSQYTIFQAYVSTAKSFCGGDYKSNQGFISSPGYPLNYPANIECIWVLKASPGNRFELEIADFGIETSEYCNGDYLEIRQHNSSGQLVADRRLCGTRDDQPATLDFDFVGDVWIKFRSDASGTGIGFLLKFSSALNTVLNSDFGQIASPGFPNTFHFYNRTFTWSVVATPGTYVKLNFLEFDLMGSVPNCFAQLSIFNGIIDFGQMDSARLADNKLESFPISSLPKPKAFYCGNQLPKSFISDSNAITLTYSTNYYSHFQPGRFLLEYSTVNSSQLPSFEDFYEGVPANVNETFKIFVDKGKNFTLTHNNYSSEDFGNTIDWYFETVSSMHFNVTSSRVSFKPSTSCWMNHFHLYHWAHWSRKWALVRQFCNGYSGTTEIPGTAALRLHLQHIRSNEVALIKPKYNFTFFPICGGNFTEPDGTISMDDFNDGYGSTDCSWNVKVRQGRTIKFKVEFYSIGRESFSCSREFIQIRNGRFTDSPLLVAPLCGHNTTAFVLPETSANYAFIRVKSSVTSNNFRIHYQEVGLTCGGELVLHTPQDVIQFTSPEYPESPSHDVVCEWVIRGPLDGGLQINFQQERYSNCDVDVSYLQIFNGGSSLSSEIAKYCAPPYNVNTVVVPSNIAFVRFVMTERNFKAKFNASVHVDRCHREYYVGVSSRELTLPVEDFSMSSSKTSDQECSIHLRTHPSYFITLNLTYAKLEGDNCTHGDVINFHDGPKVPFVFQQFCADTQDVVGQSVSSVENELFITFQRLHLIGKAFSENRSSFVGIKFRVQTKYRKCQQTIDARLSPSGVIRSPNYPRAVNRRLSCYWRLIGEPGSRFVIHFNHFDLGTSPPSGVTLKRCKKQLMIMPNIYSPKHMVETFGCRLDPTMSDVYSLSNMMIVSLHAKDLAEREGFSFSYQNIFDNQSCSALLDQPRGQVESLRTNSTKVGCAWEVAVGANQSATFVLDTYDVPGDCYNSSLTTTTAGLSEHAYYFMSVMCITRQNAPQIKGKKYIMPVLAKPIEVRNPLVLFNFNRTDPSQKGLRGEYFIQNCGGIFTDFVGEFTSLNYPGSIPEDTFCHWLFQNSDEDSDVPTASSGYKLTFTEFDLSDNCDQEYFTVKPRFRAQSHEKFCARDGMPREIFVGHDLLVSFVSSRNLSSPGIPPGTPSTPLSTSVRKFKFRIERVQHGCGGLILSHLGFLQSPNYSNSSDTTSTSLVKTPRQYPSNSECVWLVKAIPDFHLEFTFSGRFDLEQSTNCTADFLQFEERRITFVGEAEIESWKVLNRTCGHKLPDPIVSNTNLVRVTFRSNENNSGDGFRVGFEQKCGGLFEDDNGTIVSPHYEEGVYASELSCVYKLQRKDYEFIEIQFDDFDLEYHPSCIFDAMWIYLGDHLNKTTPKYGPYCGTTLPPKLASAGQLTIVFHSDHFVSKRGFKLHFGVTSCGGNVTATSGQIVSPPFMKQWSGCVWRIQTPDVNSSLALRVVELDLANQHCRTDCCNTLSISEGAGIYDSISLGYLCSDMHSDLTYKAQGNQMVVQLRKGAMTQGHEAKFKLIFWTTPGKKQGCGGVFNGQAEGVISTPDIDGDSYYEPSLDCIWSISATNMLTHFVELTFERFDVEPGNSSDSCENDYLDVYDGKTIHSPLLARLCGRDSIPEKIHSSADVLLLHFVSNSDVSGHGFRARFTLQNQTCGGVLIPRETLQSITSPGYPTEYSAPLQCQWKLVNSYFYGQPLVLTFHDLDLNCSRGDFIQVASQAISDADYLVKAPLTLCAASGKMKVVANEKMLLTYKTFDSPHLGGLGYDNANFMQTKANLTKSSYRGFNVTYHFSLCNETLDGLDNGFAMSQNFPQEQNIYREYTCFLNISVPEGRRIALYFSRFQFYACQHSNLTIYEPSQGPKARATFCDMHTSPSPYFSASNNLTIAIRATRRKLDRIDPLKPDLKNNRILYSFNYFSTPIADGPAGCGGNLTGNSGVFSSPHYPASFAEGGTCKWLITTNGYHSIALTFEFFRLSYGCQSTKLEIFDGTEENEEKRLASFCSNDKPATIVSTSNALLVRLTSSTSNYEPGFLATYRVNTKEPRIKGRVITSETFKYYSHGNSFYSLH